MQSLFQTLPLLLASPQTFVGHLELLFQQSFLLPRLLRRVLGGGHFRPQPPVLLRFVVHRHQPVALAVLQHE